MILDSGTLLLHLGKLLLINLETDQSYTYFDIVDHLQLQHLRLHQKQPQPLKKLLYLVDLVDLVDLVVLVEDTNPQFLPITQTLMG